MKHTPDIALHNGKIYTLDAANSIASALAIRGNRIVAIGDDATIQSICGPATTCIDLGGNMLLPGFIESHGHFMWLGEVRTQIDLTEVDSVANVAQLVADKVQTVSAGEWIFGNNWDQSLWGGAFPDARSLTAVAPDNPVVLVRRDGHSWWLNQAALDVAGINVDTPDPEGGAFIRDANGVPTGILVDNAFSVLAPHIPAATDAQFQRFFEIARDECLRLGITSFHEMRTEKRDLALFQKLAQDGALFPRQYCFLNSNDADLLATNYAKGPQIDPFGLLTVRGIKMFADGALGSRGASLMDDYADAPGNKGLATLSTGEMLRRGLEAVKQGFHISIHAIGDQAAHDVLNVYEALLAANPTATDLRFRLEHAQTLHPDDVPRFADLGVVAVLQAAHFTSDMVFLDERLGQARRQKRASRWRDLIDHGVAISGSSDTPLERLDPITGIYASVTRKHQNDTLAQGWDVDQCMTREEAVRSYTLGGAYAAFEEQSKGSIEVGKLADLVLLSQDLMTVSEDAILDTKVLFTMLDGKIVYEA